MPYAHRMVAIITVVVALATSLLTLAIAIASGQIFSGHGWLVPYLVVASIVFYVLALVLAIAHWMRKTKEKDKATVSDQQTQTVRQEANPQQNVYIGADVLTRDSGDRKESLPSTSTATEPKTNFQFVETRAIRAHAGLGDSRIYESPQGLGDFQVSVVCFRNDAIVGKPVRQPNLKAHIVYKNKNGQEITDVPRGVWLDHYGESILFETGKRRCLILFLLSKQGTVMKVWNDSYRTSQSWMSGGPSFRIRTEAMSENVASVEVNLLGREVCFLQAVFDVKPHDSDGLPSLSLKFISGE
jgi:hypothetical protein